MDGDEQGLPPLWRRCVLTFVSPGRLFDGLRDRPAWFGALLLATILTAVATHFVPDEAWRAMLRSQMLRLGGDPQGLEAALRMIPAYTALAAITTFIFTFVFTAVITVVFAFLLGDEGSFRQYLAVVSHASLISAVGALIVLPLRIGQLDPQLTLSVGTFLPFLQEGYLQRVLRGLDLFGLWSLIVMALGVSEVDPKRRWGTAAIILLVFFVGLIAAVSTVGG